MELKNKYLKFLMYFHKFSKFERNFWRGQPKHQGFFLLVWQVFIKMYQTQWNFATCLMIQWAISSYFINIIKNHPVWVGICLRCRYEWVFVWDAGMSGYFPPVHNWPSYLILYLYRYREYKYTQPQFFFKSTFCVPIFINESKTWVKHE